MSSKPGLGLLLLLLTVLIRGPIEPPSPACLVPVPYHCDPRP